MFVVKSLILCVVLVTLMGSSSGYMYRTMAQSHPEHPGKCYWAKTATAINVGDTYRIPNDCAEASCYGDFSFSVMGCGVQMFDDPSCHEVEPDLSLPYPQCCQAWECVDKDGNKSRF